MENLEQELKEYFNDIKKKLICSTDVKKSFMIEFKNRIADFIDENSDVTMEMIYNNFGTADVIIKSFNDESDFYKRKAKKRLIISIVVAVVAGLFIWAICMPF